MTWEEIGDSTWDAVVIGAGPAGSIAARELARAGARTLLVERSIFPRWKVCGACLNGHALGLIREAGLGESIGVSPVSAVGIADAAPHPVPLDRFELRSRGRAAILRLPEGVALSRARLDAAFAQAATESGATVLFGTLAHVGAVRGGTRLVRLVHRGHSSHIRSGVVLNAAGLGGKCLPPGAAPGIEIARRSRVGAGCVIRDVSAAYPPGTIFMAAGRRGYVGLVRVEDHSLNVAAAIDPGFVRSRGSPALAARAILAEAGFPALLGLESADWRGTPALTRRVRPPGDERLFLLGDAAGYVEPFTGEGMAWAIASGLAVAPLALRAIEGWTPGLVREWSAVHRRSVGRRQRLCRAASLALRRPWLVPLVFGALTRWPAGSGFVLRRLNASSLLPSR